eukprot:5826273-Amphidinium_carterae.1
MDRRLASKCALSLVAHALDFAARIPSVAPVSERQLGQPIKPLELKALGIQWTAGSDSDLFGVGGTWKS